MRPTSTIWFDLPHRFEHRLGLGDTTVDIHADGQKARLDESPERLTLTLHEPLALQSAGVPVLLHGVDLDKRTPSLVLQAQVPLRPNDARTWLETSPKPNRIAQVARFTHHHGAAVAAVAGYTLASAGLVPALSVLAGAKGLKHLARCWATKTVQARLPRDLEGWQPAISGLLAGKIMRLPVDPSDLIATGAGATEALVSLADNGLSTLRALSQHVDFGSTDLHIALQPASPSGNDRAVGGGLTVRDLNLHLRPTQAGQADAVHAHLKMKLRKGRENPLVQEVDLRTDFRLPKPWSPHGESNGSPRDATPPAEHFLPPSGAFMEQMQGWLSGVNASGRLVLRGRNQSLSSVARLKVDDGAVLDVTTVRAAGRPGVIRLIPPKDSQRNIRVKLQLQGRYRAKYEQADADGKYVHHHRLTRAVRHTRDTVRQVMHQAGLSITYLQAIDIVPASLLQLGERERPVVDIQLSHGFGHTLSPNLMVQSSNNVWNGSWHPGPSTSEADANGDTVLLQIPRYVMPVDAEQWQHWSQVAEGVVRLLDRVDCRDGGLLDIGCLTGHHAELGFGVEHARRATSAVFHVAAGDHIGKVAWTTIAPMRLAYDQDDD